MDTILLTTDDAAAAQACAARPLGFTCEVRQMDRRRFAARESIELRAGAGEIQASSAGKPDATPPSWPARRSPSLPHLPSP